MKSKSVSKLALRTRTIELNAHFTRKNNMSNFMNVGSL